MFAPKPAASRGPPRGRDSVAAGEAEMLAKVAAAVSRCLSARPPVVTIQRVAIMTGMNVRTLQRRLASAGYSFRDLREMEYQRVAMACLASGAMSVREISEKLGYSHPAHFARAFRRWTGRSPTVYARGQGSSLA